MDLWALGGIIYYMVTGRKPFDAESNEKIIEKILSKDLYWSKEDEKNLSEECIDIIDKLLHLQPSLRLGAGKEGTPQDFYNLMNHSWFSSITDIKRCFSEPVPLNFEPTLLYATKDHKKKLLKKFNATK
jgi:serine/threonine protein kinase